MSAAVHVSLPYYKGIKTTQLKGKKAQRNNNRATQGQQQRGDRGATVSSQDQRPRTNTKTQRGPRVQITSRLRPVSCQAKMAAVRWQEAACAQIFPQNALGSGHLKRKTRQLHGLGRDPFVGSGSGSISSACHMPFLTRARCLSAGPPHLSLTRGPAGIRSTTGSLSTSVLPVICFSMNMAVRM